tara:strand:- start:5 stop:127 length:123 start_codon:yes stop_codon:yes gene_type:complete
MFMLLSFYQRFFSSMNTNEDEAKSAGAVPPVNANVATTRM